MIIVPISQNDPLWKDTLIGTGTLLTIGVWGCLLTCLTMLVSLFGENETPLSLNYKMVVSKNFIGPNIVPARIPNVLPRMIFNYFRVYQGLAPFYKIDAILLKGLPVIVMLDSSPVSGVQSHFVLIYKKVDKDYAIYDPFSYPVDTKEILLGKRYGLESVIGIISMDYMRMDKKE